VLGRSKISGNHPEILLDNGIFVIICRFSFNQGLKIEELSLSIMSYYAARSPSLSISLWPDLPPTHLSLSLWPDLPPPSVVPVIPFPLSGFSLGGRSPSTVLQRRSVPADLAAISVSGDAKNKGTPALPLSLSLSPLS
jgi:hypothetical protein